MNHLRASLFLLCAATASSSCTRVVDPTVGVGRVEGRLRLASPPVDLAEQTVIASTELWLAGSPDTPVRSATDGTFTFNDVPFGQHLLLATSTVGVSAGLEFELYASTTSVTLTLRPAACVRGAATGGTSNATVEIDGLPFTADTNSSGQFHAYLPEALAGTSIRARADGELSGSTSVPETTASCEADLLCTVELCATLCTPDTCCGQQGLPCCPLATACAEGLRCHEGLCGCGPRCIVGEVQCGERGRRVCRERENGCVTWTDWHAPPTAEERPDYYDDNCDGEVDEDWRVTLYRRHSSNGYGWEEPGADSDHCYSYSPAAEGPCIANPASNVPIGLTPYLRDGHAIRVYQASVVDHPAVQRTNGESQARIGPIDVALLVECFDSEHTVHWYLFDSSPQAQDARTAGFACEPVGYVRTEEHQQLADDDLTIYGLYHWNASDAMYSCLPGEARDLGFEQQGQAFFAWQSPEFDCGTPCGDGRCTLSETPGNCPGDCAPLTGATHLARETTTDVFCDTSPAGAGWHRITRRQHPTRRWTFGTCCPVTQPETPAAYGYEYATAEFEVRKTGRYRVVATLPEIPPEECPWGDCVTTGAFYGVSGPNFAATATVNQRDQQGATAVLLEADLPAGTLTVALYDRILDIDEETCSACAACDVCPGRDPCSGSARYRRVLWGPIALEFVED